MALLNSSSIPIRPQWRSFFAGAPVIYQGYVIVLVVLLRTYSLSKELCNGTILQCGSGDGQDIDVGGG